MRLTTTDFRVLAFCWLLCMAIRYAANGCAKNEEKMPSDEEREFLLQQRVDFQSDFAETNPDGKM